MNTKYLLAAAIVAVISAWMFYGMVSEPAAKEVTVTTAGEAAERPGMTLVRGVKSHARLQTVYLDVRGQTRANRVVQVKSEVSGKIVSLPGEKGQVVRQGDILCSIAIDARQHEYDQAVAEVDSAQLEFDGSSDLNRKGLQSEVLMAQSKAMLEESRTKAERARLALQKTKLRAPFDGVVANQFVEVGDYLTPDSPCVNLIEINPMLIAGQVAERDVGRISLNDEVIVNLITGETHTGIVSFIGHAPDLATRTFPIEVTVPNASGSIRTGITSDMRVPVGTEQVHTISPANLVLNDLGIVGIRVVDEQSKVRFLPVQVVDESPSGVLVKGLPESINLITVGQEEVFDGQQVTIDYSPLTTLVGF